MAESQEARRIAESWTDYPVPPHGTLAYREFALARAYLKLLTEQDELREKCGRAIEQLEKFGVKGPKQVGRALITLEDALGAPVEAEAPERGEREEETKAEMRQEGEQAERWSEGTGER